MDHKKQGYAINLMTPPLLYDSHMHTPLCKHAKGRPEEYAEVAERRHLKGIIFTCHNPGPKGWDPRIRMSLDQFDTYVDMVQRAREAWAGRVDIRLGLESDYFPGMEPFLEKLHTQANLHCVLGSVHPHAPYYRETYYQGDILAYQRTYFHHIAAAAESGLFDVITHPDLVKTVFPDNWDPFLLWDDIKRSLDRIAKTGVAMELNTSGLNKKIKEMNPGAHILAEMKVRDIPVVIGSDSHEPKRVGADFDLALNLLEEVGYTYVCYFLERRRQKADIQTAKRSLGPDKRKVPWR